MTQEEANKLSYRERYKRYKNYMAQLHGHAKFNMTYANWLKYSATAEIPPDCRTGQGKEPWHK